MGRHLVALLIMAHIDIPHLSLPFRFEQHTTEAKHAVVTEQDSIDDIANCVEMIIKTPAGWRDDNPDFGLPDLAFKTLPIRPDTIEQLMEEQEPRVVILAREQSDALDQLTTILTVELHARGGNE